jgi:Phage minor capsid protein 2.
MLSWKDISDLFVSIELKLIASLKRNLAGHKAWEREEGFNWPAWQTEKLKHVEHFRQENKSIMNKYSDVIDFQTRKLMAEQYAEGRDYVNREAEAAEVWSGRSQDAWSQRGDRVTQLAWNRPREQKPEGLSEDHFFGVNDHRLENLMQDMHEAEQKAQTATLRMMDDVYRRTISQAATAMAAGTTTLPQAIDMAVKDFLRAGINCIEYSNGARVNIADYVQMALRTAATRSYLQGEAKRRAELGIDTVLVSQYGACSNTCLPWQGRVYIDDVWGEFKGQTKNGRGLSVNGNWYPLLSVAVKAGLFHPNCRHTLTTWIEGISKLPDPMDTAKIKENSALEQQQRSMEKRVREYKRMAEGFQQPSLKKEYKRKTSAAQKELREFISEHSDVLRRDYWREKTYDIPMGGDPNISP